MTVLIATPTWNRRAIVSLTAAALQVSDRRPEDTDYLVTDDASTEYTEEDLKALFPWARIIRHPQRHSNHLMNTYVCFSEFLKGTYSHLVILDSDMIVSPDWRNRLEDLIQTPDFRIGSLYNSQSHRVTQDCGSYCVKATAGFAGMVFTREVLQVFLDLRGPASSALGLREPASSALGLREPASSALGLREPASSADLQGPKGSIVKHDHDDFAVCRFVGPIFHVTKPSVLAHIGINGLYNGSDYNTIDRAADFVWSSIDPGLKKACEDLLKVNLT